MTDLTASLPLIARAVVVGVLGGVGLVLTQLNSRRGPLIYPVYAAILATLAFVTARFPTLPFAASFIAVFTGMVVATSIAFAGVVVLGARQRRELRASGRAFVSRSGAPWWSLPVVVLSMVASSAAVAFLSS